MSATSYFDIASLEREVLEILVKLTKLNVDFGKESVDAVGGRSGEVVGEKTKLELNH